MRLKVLFFLTLTCVYLTLAQGSYEDCCLSYVQAMTRNAKRMVASYRIQETDGGCNIPAVVFTMKKGKQYCAKPNQRWVNELMLKVGIKTKKKQMRKPKRLRG
ncbi:hypothetical protein UPYG_G00296540 [Umbra pygmaea]|uniref:Chemokine interleukin-8-like domain-containing protein n=1 Tax=Umbra pygmaea TaxID=75934 RepID=A0ABD0WAD0_UMBPY